MKTIHVIFNAHIDPVWLWPWQAGLDAALNTCRTACDLLERHPDLCFTQGEAWVFQQVQRIEPRLFKRMRKHVAAGRWQIVGWWIQPDCNAPSGFALERQISLGINWFREHLGIAPRTAYNIDSFGHAASLPGMMRAASQERYVMMRPQEHEMTLPARFFRWRGFENGPEVITFRVARSYCTGLSWLTPDHLRGAVADVPPDFEHTMCFAGVGDHGGGATEGQIAWFREHAHDVPGWQAEFSTPDRFFDAIWSRREKLPLVTGELQHHAVGCYTVTRLVKIRVREAEHRVRQAELLNERHPQPGAAKRLGEAWEHVCFHQFHDTLGGTCIPSACRQVEQQLAAAQAAADEILQTGWRRITGTLPGDPRQRLAFFNASDSPFSGPTEFEPWLDWQKWEPHWRLLDEKGKVVPCQVMSPEALAHGPARLLFHLDCGPGEQRVLRIDRDAAKENAAPTVNPIRIDGEQAVVVPATGCGVKLGESGALELGAGIASLRLPRLDLIEDPSDTWSHGIDRYGERLPLESAWDKPMLLDRGPLMAALLCTGTLGESRLTAEYRVYAEECFIELLLTIDWRAVRKVLKLTLTPPGVIQGHCDGIPGASIERPACGRERPLRDFTLLRLADGAALGIVCPDTLALDVTPERARLTLLRSPHMAWHDPYREQNPRGVVADQGRHLFRFRFFAGESATPARLNQEALMLQRPLVAAELTRGMPVYPLVP